MNRLLPRPQHPRRGVTLVEMLVVVALLVLMMTIIVSIFGAATGAVSVSKAYQELDDELRRIDSTLRQDLIGSTARMNPPIDPDENLGYFEYIENSFSDAQGEDTDDCLRFTVHAPPGQPFTGRFYVNTSAFNVATPNLYNTTQPITITSEYAEIIYFLRHGNLYRRVLLIVPELQSVVNTDVTSTGIPISNFYTGMFGMFGSTLPSVSWQGVNDISAHPSPVSSPSGIALPPVLNTLGSLTNRENRAFSPRFANDFDKNGIPDDYNVDTSGNVMGDGVPDYYPTLYPGLFSASGSFTATGGLLYNEFGGTRTLTSGAANSYSIFPFPYIFPGAYSKSDSYTLNTNIGLIHSIDPTNTTSVINTFNHAPLDIGDSLAVPTPTNTNQLQTWWGFPTWHETMSPFWLDPIWQVNMNLNQTAGLQPFSPTANPPANNGNLLPAVGGLQLFSDIAGSNSSFTGVYVAPYDLAIWEDDLLMTGVRSFDVKGYDPGFSNYIDLGYSGGATGALPTFISGFANLAQAISSLPTLQHEGRIPPIPADFRFDPQAKEKGIFNNVGDGQPSVIRLRRTWDSWSTDYTQAPANGYVPTLPNLPYGPNYYVPGNALANPVYPSYPPPYEAPLRGIQIQVRVVDPRNERIKVLTIRHDFSDKIYKKR